MIYLLIYLFIYYVFLMTFFHTDTSSILVYYRSSPKLAWSWTNYTNMVLSKIQNTGITLQYWFGHSPMGH